MAKFKIGDRVALTTLKDIGYTDKVRYATSRLKVGDVGVIIEGYSPEEGIYQVKFEDIIPVRSYMFEAFELELINSGDHNG